MFRSVRSFEFTSAKAIGIFTAVVALASSVLPSSSPGQDAGKAAPAPAPAAPAKQPAQPAIPKAKAVDNYSVISFSDNEIASSKKKYEEIKAAKNLITLGSKPFDEAAKADLKKWYRNFFAAMTQPDQMIQLPDKRKELSKDLKDAISLAKNVELHRYIMSDFAFKIPKVLVSPKYHPAVRYNAMLMIGDLNRRESTPQRTSTDPLPEALTFILSEMDNPEQIDPVRIAGMIGISRHVQLNQLRSDAEKMKPDEQQRIRKMMQDLLVASPPTGRPKEAHEWMQRSAIEILTTMGELRSQNTLTLVEGIVPDAKRGMALRCASAKALKALDTNSKAKVDPALSAYRMSTLAGDACRAELAILEKQTRRQAAGMMGMPGGMGGMPGMGDDGGSGMAGGMGAMGMGMSGGGMGMPGGMGGMGSGMGGMGMMEMKLDPRLVPVQRRLLTELQCVVDGLKGIKSTVGDSTQGIDDVDRAAQALITTLHGPEKKDDKKDKDKERADPRKLPQPLTPESLVKDLKKKIDEFDRIAQKFGPKDAAPKGPADDDDGLGAPAQEKAAAVPGPARR